MKIGSPSITISKLPKKRKKPELASTHSYPLNESIPTYERLNEDYVADGMNHLTTQFIRKMANSIQSTPHSP